MVGPLCNVASKDDEGVATVHGSLLRKMLPKMFGCVGTASGVGNYTLDDAPTSYSTFLMVIACRSLCA